MTILPAGRIAKVNGRNVLRSIGFVKQRMLNALNTRDMDDIVIALPENVFYITGYPALPSSGNPILYTLRNRLPSFVHVSRESKVTLVCWGFSVEGVSVDVDTVLGITSASESIDAVIGLLSRRDGRDARIGIETSAPYELYKAILAKLPKCHLVDADEVMTELRLVKTPAEIDQIAKSTDVIGRTMAELFDLLRVGMSRLELIREAKHRLLKNGADGVSHATFTFGKENPEIALDEHLENNNLITLDLGGIVNGYCSDTRRYAFSGKPPQALTTTYEKMVRIVDEVGEATKPGATYGDISRIARSLFSDYGLEPMARMTHVGHNIGIETEEQWVDASQSVIVPSMVVNIELYTLCPPFGQIGNEETFVVTSTGTERISGLPREIRSI